MSANRDDLSPEELEFGKNAGDSSKDNFLTWMADQLDQLQERFDWSDAEVNAVAKLLASARDNAIEDFGAALTDLKKLMDLDNKR